MNEFLRQLWESIVKLHRAPRIWLTVSAMLLTAGIIGATSWRSTEEFVPLFTEQINIEDAAALTARLTRDNIPFRLSKDTTEILVPPFDRPAILMQLACEGSCRQ